jgi:hypothetical protein
MSELSASENCVLALNTAKSIRIFTPNADLPDIVHNLTWQLIRMALTRTINLTNHPELYRLLKDGETLADCIELSPETILLRWLNYHLKQAGSTRVATNFIKDLTIPKFEQSL